MKRTKLQTRKLSPFLMFLIVLGTFSGMYINSAQAGFNWGGNCTGGSGSFNQPVAKSKVLLVGTIPPNKKDVSIRLTSAKDVDIQLIDKATNKLLIAWPKGVLHSSGKSCTTFHNIQYCYSGYNGDGTNLGNEWIKISGNTNRELIMKVYGYQAGNALVKYDWKAATNCQSKGSGSFSQSLAQKQITTIGDIPAGKKNIIIKLTAIHDLDIQLYDGQVALIKWPSGKLNGAGRQELNYMGMKIVWSGYNGDGVKLGNEYIHIIGTVSRKLTMKAYGYKAGVATVNYSWGNTFSGGGTGSGTNASPCNGVCVWGKTCSDYCPPKASCQGTTQNGKTTWKILGCLVNP